jgi:Dihydrodipicolinate synthase/N-acetylneuraminate lyase
MSGSYTRSVLCPIVTPFTSGDDNDTNVDHAGLRSVIEFVSDAGIDGIIGLKDSGGDFDYILEVLSKTDSSFHVFEGYDRHYVSGVHAGTAGGINALANVLPERFDTIRNTTFRGDTQTALEIEQSALAPLFDFCVEYGFAPVTKAGLAYRGIIDSARVRLPLVELPNNAHSRVTSLISDAIVDE